MKSDTRANLLFLLIFLALSLPGAFILARKSYYKGGRGMMPLPVRTELAYMDPTLRIGAHRPAVPPRVGQFVLRIAKNLARMQPGLMPAVQDPPQVGIMSEQYHLELLGSGAHEGMFRVALLGWNTEFLPLPTLYRFVGQRGEQPVIGDMTAYEQANLPLDLREELQNFGYIKPPGSTTWMIVTFPGEAPINTLQFDFNIDKIKIADTLRLTRSPTTQPVP